MASRAHDLAVIGYKVLTASGGATHGTGKWIPGKPRSVRGELVPCRNGIHYCRKDQLVGWLSSGPAIWSFEDLTPDETVDAGDKMVTRKGVVWARFEMWDDRTARLFAADCAERALRLVKKRGYAVDPRSTTAVKAARLFAGGKIGHDELAAARDAAWDAARAVAWDVARAVAWDVAWDAARAAAWAAARDAARDAAGAAAWDTERKWQTKRLFDYLEGQRG